MLPPDGKSKFVVQSKYYGIVKKATINKWNNKANIVCKKKYTPINLIIKKHFACYYNINIIIPVIAIRICIIIHDCSIILIIISILVVIKYII